MNKSTLYSMVACSIPILNDQAPINFIALKRIKCGIMGGNLRKFKAYIKEHPYNFQKNKYLDCLHAGYMLYSVVLYLTDRYIVQCCTVQVREQKSREMNKLIY